MKKTWYFKKFEFRKKETIIILSVYILFLAFEIFVAYTPVLNESIIGYLIVLPLFGLTILALLGGILSLMTLIVTFFSKEKVPWYLLVYIIISFTMPIFLHARTIMLETIQVPLPTGSDKTQFNKQQWVENKIVNWRLSPRQAMLQDAVNKLPGKSKDEVLELLGDEYGSYTRDFKSKPDLMYYLGESRTENPGEEWLLIWFDENGIFEKYHIYTTVA